jgi:hypothetical protein
MGKYTKWITYNDKRILTVNVARLSEAEIIAGLEEMKQELLRDRSGPLLLIDISGIDMTTAVINKAKDLTAATKDEGIQDGPNAIVGLTGLQKAVAQLFARGVHFCNSAGEAKDWLVKQDNKHR